MTSTLNPYFVSPSVHTETLFGNYKSNNTRTQSNTIAPKPAARSVFYPFKKKNESEDARLQRERIDRTNEDLLLYADLNKYNALIEKEDEALRIHAQRKADLEYKRDIVRTQYDKAGKWSS